MKILLIAMGLILNIFFASETVSASIIRFDISGSLSMWNDSDESSITCPITGHVYISDFGVIQPYDSGLYDIVLYDIFINNKHLIEPGMGSIQVCNFDVYTSIGGGLFEGMTSVEGWKNNYAMPSEMDFMSVPAFDWTYTPVSWIDCINGSEIYTYNTCSFELLRDYAAPVPEPATMLLLGTGLIGIAGSRLRIRKK